MVNVRVRLVSVDGWASGLFTYARKDRHALSTPRMVTAIIILIIS